MFVFRLKCYCKCVRTRPKQNRPFQRLYARIGGLNVAGRFFRAKLECLVYIRITTDIYVQVICWSFLYSTALKEEEIDS